MKVGKGKKKRRKTQRMTERKIGKEVQKVSWL